MEIENIATKKDFIMTSVVITMKVIEFVGRHRGPIGTVASDGYCNYDPGFNISLGEVFHVDGVSEDKKILLLSNDDGRLTNFPSALFPEFDIDAWIDLQERRKFKMIQERRFEEAVNKVDWLQYRNNCAHDLLIALLSHRAASACINAKAEELKMPVQKYAARLAVEYTDCLIEILKTMPHEW
jgi:hypothetical protein